MDDEIAALEKEIMAMDDNKTETKKPENPPVNIGKNVYIKLKLFY
jgi:hypothetical protein